MASERSEPLRLHEDALELGFALDFHILLRAIDEAMPADAILVLEGGSTAAAVAAFLRAREPDVRPAILGGKDEVFHLPLADGNLTALRALAEEYARFEIAEHLAVYRDREVLLVAHDAGDGAVLLASSLPDETLERFQAALGSTLSVPRRYRWFGLGRTRNK